MGSPGVDEVKWLKPVRPGDRLTARAKVIEKHASRTRPEAGFVGFLFEVTNQAGEVVMTLASTLMVARRNSAVPRSAARPSERGDP